MFPGCRAHAVTNGVHGGFWTQPAFTRLPNIHIPRWWYEPETLVHAQQFSDEEDWTC